jgi:hypothetical protein
MITSLSIIETILGKDSFANFLSLAALVISGHSYYRGNKERKKNIEIISKITKIAEEASQRSISSEQFTYYANIRPWFLLSSEQKIDNSSCRFSIANYGNLIGDLYVSSGPSDKKQSSLVYVTGKLDTYSHDTLITSMIHLNAPKDTDNYYFSFEFDDKFGRRWREIYELSKYKDTYIRFVPHSHEEITKSFHPITTMRIVDALVKSSMPLTPPL